MSPARIVTLAALGAVTWLAREVVAANADYATARRPEQDDLMALATPCNCRACSALDGPTPEFIADTRRLVMAESRRLRSVKS